MDASVKTVRPASQFLTNLAGRATVASVTNKTHSTPTASNVKPLDDDDPRHGTVGGYTNYNCRCADCCVANTAQHRDYMKRHPEQREKVTRRQRERRNRLRLEREALR